MENRQLAYFSLLLSILLAACGSQSLGEMPPIPTLEDGELIGQPAGQLPAEQLRNIMELAGGVEVSGSYAYIEKIDSHLQSLLSDYLSGRDVILSAERNAIQLVDGNRILAAIHLQEYDPELVDKFEQVGMQITATNEEFQVVEGEIPLDAVLLVAIEDGVSAILPIRSFGTDE